MIDDETANELGDLYELFANNLEWIKRYVSTVDALVRTMSLFQELAAPLERCLGDGQLLPNTLEVIKIVDLTLAAVQAKAAYFRRGPIPGSGLVN